MFSLKRRSSSTSSFYRSAGGLAVLLLLASCANIVYRHATSNLHVGSGMDKVVLAMGSEPAEKKSFGDRDVMVYYVYSSIFDLFINWDRFPYFGFYPLLSTGQEFWIILNGASVEAFGYAKNFGNSLKNIKSTTQLPNHQLSGD